MADAAQSDNVSDAIIINKEHNSQHEVIDEVCQLTSI